MRHLVFIPCSGRLDSFSAALQSVVLSSSSVDHLHLIIDLSNEALFESVSSIVSSVITFNSPISYVVCIRDNSVPMISAWFNSIFEHSCDGDLVHFLGDDDLLIPHSISIRADILSSADYAVFKCLSRIFFLSQARFVADFAHTDKYLDYKPDNNLFRDWDPHADNLYQSFISICSFKASSKLKHYIYALLDILNNQDWIDPTYREGMFFYYFPFYLRYHTSLRVVQSDVLVSIRGARITDMYRGDYSDGGSRGLYLAAAYHAITSLMTLPEDVVKSQTSALGHYIQSAHRMALYHATKASYMATIARLSLEGIPLPRSYTRIELFFIKLFSLHSCARIRQFIFRMILKFRGIKVFPLTNFLTLLNKICA